MRVNPNVSEEQNLVDHINLINEFPFTLDDISFGLPKSIVTLPESVTEDDYLDNKFRLKNTSVKVSANPTSTKWSGDSSVRKYRRIHLGVQWLKYHVRGTYEGGRFIIETDTWHHDVPTVGEVYNAIRNQVVFREPSLSLDVLQYTPNGLNYDTGRLRVKAKVNSLIYIGYFEMDVVFKPISFLPPVLVGFHGIKKVNQFESTDNSFIPESLGCFTI